MTNTLLIIAFVILAFQIVMFFINRFQKRNIKTNSVTGKYNIQSRNDAWKLLNDPGISKKDKLKIQELYKKFVK